MRHRISDEPQDRAELAALLPAPGDPRLSPERHLLLKDHLMETITRAGTPARPVPARRLLALVAAPAITFVAVLVVVATLLWAPRSADPGRGNGAPAATAGVDGPAGPPTAVVPLLDRVAFAAGTNAVAVRAGQFLYVRTTRRFSNVPPAGSGRQSNPTGSGRQSNPVWTEEAWISADPAVKGVTRKSGTGLPDVDGVDLPTDLGPIVATLRGQLATLPTEPGALLDRIYAAVGGDERGPGTAAFVTIGLLLHFTPLTPELSAALYRAIGRIPGIAMIDDEVDEAGRHGVALAITDPLGRRTTWVFDKATFAFLGEHNAMVGTDGRTTPGGLRTSYAVTARGAVDAVGRHP